MKLFPFLFLILIACGENQQKNISPQENIQKTDDGGSGVGNGGLGYICRTNNQNQDLITLTLDVAENLSKHYSKDYFINEYDMNKGLVAQYIERPENPSTKPEYCGAYCEELRNKIDGQLFDKLKRLFIEKIKVNNQILKNELTKDEIIRVYQFKEKFSHAQGAFSTDYTRSFVDNETQDTGNIKVTEEDLKAYGLYECYLTQIAFHDEVKKEGQRYAYDLNRSEGKIEIDVFLSGHALQYLDNYNLVALLWHEMIYYALQERTSERTRRIVSKIMEEYYKTNASTRLMWKPN